MKKILLGIVLIAFASDTLCAQNFNYSFEKTTETYSSLVDSASVKITEVWGDNTYSFPIGFDFIFAGTSFESLNLRTFGVLTFGNDSKYNFVSLLKGFTCEIDQAGESLSPILYQLDSNNHKILKMEFRNVSLTLANNNKVNVNFQIWLNEQNNAIEFRMGSISGALENEKCQLGLINMVNTIDFQVGYLLSGNASNSSGNLILAGGIPTELNDFPAENTVYRFVANVN